MAAFVPGLVSPFSEETSLSIRPSISPLPTTSLILVDAFNWTRKTRAQNKIRVDEDSISIKKSHLPSI